LAECIRAWFVGLELPCEVLALAYSVEGERLLLRFDFAKIQPASAIPDHAPLYGLNLEVIDLAEAKERAILDRFFEAK